MKIAAIVWLSLMGLFVVMATIGMILQARKGNEEAQQWLFGYGLGAFIVITILSLMKVFG